MNLWYTTNTLTGTRNENLLRVMTEDRRPMTGCLLSVAGPKGRLRTLPSPVSGRIFEGEK
jgi:hypothetical protein